MSKIFDDSKIKQAQEVLKRVLKAKGLPKDVFYLDTYQNCREAGFVIRGGVYAHTTNKAFHGGDIYVAFSENRNSDSIVVYIDSVLGKENGGYGYVDGIGIHGNLPNDKAYQNATYFDCEKYDDAAGYIVSCLKEFVRVAKKLADEEKANYLKEQKLAKTKAA